MTARERRRLVVAVWRAAEQRYGVRVDRLFRKFVAPEKYFRGDLSSADQEKRFRRAVETFMRRDLPTIPRRAKGLLRIAGEKTPPGDGAKSESKRPRGPYKKPLSHQVAVFAWIAEAVVPPDRILQGDFRPAKRISWPPFLRRWNHEHPGDRFNSVGAMQIAWWRYRGSECVKQKYATLALRHVLQIAHGWLIQAKLRPFLLAPGGIRLKPRLTRDRLNRDFRRIAEQCRALATVLPKGMEKEKKTLNQGADLLTCDLGELTVIIPKDRNEVVRVRWSGTRQAPKRRRARPRVP